MSKLSLDIFNQDNPEYLQINRINQWISYSYNLLDSASSEELLQIFAGLNEIKIFDNKFLKKLCESMSSRLEGLTYTKLSSVLHYLHEMNYTKDLVLIENVVEKLTDNETPQRADVLSDTIWVMSKLNFQDQKFFESWVKQATDQIDYFNYHDVVKSTQAMASLRLFDADILYRLYYQAEKIFDTFPTKVHLNMAFYFSMISVNNFDEKSDNPLKALIDGFVRKVMSNLDFDCFEDTISKNQIVQIHLSKIYTIQQSVFEKFSKDIENNNSLTTSITQMKVEKFVERIFTKYKVVSEYRDQNTASNIDLKIIRDPSNPDLDVYIQVEGPTHFYINHQPYHETPIFNGATVFRNALHAKYFINPVIISYTDIDNRTYHQLILSALHTFPEGYLEMNKPFVHETEIEGLKKETIADSEIIVAKVDKSSKQGKPNKSNSKKSSKKDSEEDLDEILEQIKDIDLSPKKEITYASLLQKLKKSKKNAVVSVKMLLEKAINNNSLQEIEIILKHHDQLSPEGLSSSWYKENKNNVDLLRLVLDKISINRQESKIYIEMYNLFLRYNYEPEYLTENHLKALMYANGYGDVEMFENLLNIFPNSSNKTQLMEYFLINCGHLDNVEIANFLLFNHVDINACHSRESVEISYSLSMGYNHDGKPYSNPNKIYSDLFKLLTIPGSISSDGLANVEDVLQKAVGGSLDRGEGIEAGRGVTALHASVYYTETKVITSFLLKNGANPNTITVNDVNPLITALLVKNEKAALEILDFYPNVNIKSLSYITAAHLAAANGFTKVIDKIITLQGNIDSKIVSNSYFLTMKNTYKEDYVFHNNETPLYSAIRNNHYETAMKLIEAGASFNNYIIAKRPLYIGSHLLTETTSKQTALTLSIMYCPELVDILIARGANINDDTLELSPLMIAGLFSNVETQFKDAKLINAEDPHLAYNRAERMAGLKIFEKLIINGADLNFRDKDGDTADAYVVVSDRVSAHSVIINTIIRFEKDHVFNNIVRKAIISSLEDQGYLEGPLYFSVPGDNIFKEEVNGEELTINPLVLESLKLKHDITDSFLLEWVYTNQYSSSPLMIEDEITSGDNYQYSEFYYTLQNHYIDVAIDAVRFLNRPNIENTFKLLYDVSQSSVALVGSQIPYLNLITTPSIMQKVSYGNYLDATIDAGANLGLTVLSGVVSCMGIPIISDLSPAIHNFIIEYRTMRNIHSLYEELTDPDNDVKSAEAYQYIKDSTLDAIDKMQGILGYDLDLNDLD